MIRLRVQFAVLLAVLLAARLVLSSSAHAAPNPPTAFKILRVVAPVVPPKIVRERSGCGVWTGDTRNQFEVVWSR